MSTFDVRIGINPISWSNDDLPSLGGETPLATALAEGKRIGYQGFELGNKFPREPAALRAVLAAHGLACVSGWYSGRLAARSVDDEIAAVGPHLELLAGNGSDRHGLRRSRRFDPGGTRSRYTNGRDFAATPIGARTASASARSRATRCRVACASAITITWARTCRRPTTSTG